MTEVVLLRFESNYTSYSRSSIDDYQLEKTVWLTSMCASMVYVIRMLCGLKKAPPSHEISSFTKTNLYNKLPTQMSPANFWKVDFAPERQDGFDHYEMNKTKPLVSAMATQALAAVSKIKPRGSTWTTGDGTSQSPISTCDTKKSVIGQMQLQLVGTWMSGTARG